MDSWNFAEEEKSMKLLKVKIIDDQLKEYGFHKVQENRDEITYEMNYTHGTKKMVKVTFYGVMVYICPEEADYLIPAFLTMDEMKMFQNKIKEFRKNRKGHGR